MDSSGLYWRLPDFVLTLRQSESMSLRILAKETAIYGLSSILGRFLSFLMTPLYTYQLHSQADYGIVSNLFAYIALFMIAFTYRMETAYFRFGSEEKGNAGYSFSTAALSVLGSTLLLGSLLMVFHRPLAGLLHLPDYTDLVVLSIVILCLDALSEIPFAQLRLQSRPLRYAFIRLCGITLNILTTVFFLVLCPAILKSEGLAVLHPLIQKIYNPQYLIQYIFISNVLASGLTLLLLLPVYRRATWHFDKALWNRMLVYAAPLILVGFSYVINETFDRQIMTFLLPGTTRERFDQLGIYGANYKLAMLLSLFTQAFRYGAEPFFFKHKTAANARQLYADVALYFTIFLALGFLGVTLYIDIFKYFIDAKFWSGLGVVPILLLANLMLGLYYNLSVWYRVNDLTRWGAYIALGGAAITIGLNIWWIPTIGYMGSAWATLICYAAMAAACYIFGQRFFPVPYAIPKILGYMIAALGLYALSQWLMPAALLWRLALNTLFLAAFLVLIYLGERGKIMGYWRSRG